MKRILNFRVDDKINSFLLKNKYIVYNVDDIEELIILSKNNDIILFDLDQKNLNEKDLFLRIKQANNDIKIIGFIDNSRLRIATKLLKNKLDDYLLKDSMDINSKLLSIIEKDGVENEFLSNRDLLYYDTKIKKNINTIKKIADTKISILLEGEAGCEHENYAMGIHEISNRKDNAFLTLFCPSLTRNILEKMLYGNLDQNEKSILNIRNIKDIKNGTVFLESIDLIDYDTQILLTKLFETKESEMLQEPTKDFNIRIIASSTKDLKKEVEEGRFKRELYYRINSFTINLTPLREQRENIPIFVKILYKFYAMQEKKNINGITDRALKILESYNWFGNIKELKNTIYKAVILNNDGILDEKDFSNLGKNNEIIENNKNNLSINLLDGNDNLKNLKDIESEIIDKYVQYFKGNLSEVSKVLNIGRATLYRKLEGND